MSVNEQSPSASDKFDARLQQIADQTQTQKQHCRAKKSLWLAHHWPVDYAQRCFLIYSRPVCRRCAALYPLAFLVTVVSLAGFNLWPESIDPWPIWLLSLPATTAFVGEALGAFSYSPRWQVGTTLLAAFAFGRALAYELEGRWHPYFWGPIAVFGGIWFFASAFNRKKQVSDNN